MKYILLSLLLAATFLFSCQKEVRPSIEDPIIAKIVTRLSEQLRPDLENQPDLSRIIGSRWGTSDTAVYRVGFKNQLLETHFIAFLVIGGEITSSKVVQISGRIHSNQYNGEITISELDGSPFRYSLITNGNIEFSPLVKSVDDPITKYVVPDPYVELPEVIIVSTPRPQVNISTYYSMFMFFGEGGGGGGGGGYYVSGGGGGGGGSGSSSGTGSGDAGPSYPIPATPGNEGGSVRPRVTIDEPIVIDFENQFSNPAVDVEKYIKCFSSIPDNGATCSIEIFSDIPVDGDPSLFFDWNTGSPGHVFLKVSKSNAGKLASQYIGLYPKTGWKSTLTTAPIAGKIVDNGGHEFNASYKVSLTPEQLKTGVLRIITESRNVQYRIDHYNCTDWALNIFNAMVEPSENLSIPKYFLPGGSSQYPSNTPQGLFVKIKQMQTASPNANPNISIPLLGLAGSSTGACN